MKWTQPREPNQERESESVSERSGGRQRNEKHYAPFFAALSANYFAFSLRAFIFFALFHTQFVLLSGGCFVFVLKEKNEERRTKNEKQKSFMLPITWIIPRWRKPLFVAMFSHFALRQVIIKWMLTIFIMFERHMIYGMCVTHTKYRL